MLLKSLFLNEFHFNFVIYLGLLFLPIPIIIIVVAKFNASKNMVILSSQFPAYVKVVTLPAMIKPMLQL